MSESPDGGYTEQRRPHDDIEGKIFVGGLSWQTTEASLRFYFEKFGELSDAAIMIDKRTGQPRGFGFVTMKDPSVADIVVQTEHTIDGRLVDVKRAVPRDMAPTPSRSEARKVFVGGLAAEVTEKDFADYFSQFGVVKDAVVMVDRATNRSRGFGFITFESEDSVEAVLQSKNEIHGKWVEVKRAEPRDGPASSPSPGSLRGAPVSGGGGIYGTPGGMSPGGYGATYPRTMMDRGGMDPRARPGYPINYPSRTGMMGGVAEYGNSYPSPYMTGAVRAGGMPGAYGALRYPPGYAGAPMTGARPAGYGSTAAYGYPQPGGVSMSYYGAGTVYSTPSGGGSGAQPSYGAMSGESVYGGSAYNPALTSRSIDTTSDGPSDYTSAAGRTDTSSGYGSGGSYNYSGASSMGGYGSGYGGGAYGGASSGSSTMGGTSRGTESDNMAYGMRGPAASAATAQGRIDRSYRPY